MGRYRQRNYDNGSNAGDIAVVQPVVAVPSAAAQVINSTEFRKEFIYNNRKAVYVREYSADVSLGNKDYVEILDEEEDGELIGFFLDVNTQYMLPEVTLFGDNDSEYVVSNRTVKDLIALGFGMCPGDIVPLPDGTLPDSTGIPDPIYPFVARFKNLSYQDQVDSGLPHCVVRYSPAIRVPYNRIRIVVRNTSNASNKKINQISIDRIVYLD